MHWEAHKVILSRSPFVRAKLFSTNQSLSRSLRTPRELPILCLDPIHRSVIPSILSYLYGVVPTIDMSKRTINGIVQEDLGYEYVARLITAAKRLELPGLLQVVTDIWKASTIGSQIIGCFRSEVATDDLARGIKEVFSDNAADDDNILSRRLARWFGRWAWEECLSLQACVQFLWVCGDMFRDDLINSCYTIIRKDGSHNVRQQARCPQCDGKFLWPTDSVRSGSDMTCPFRKQQALALKFIIKSFYTTQVPGLKLGSVTYELLYDTRQKADIWYKLPGTPSDLGWKLVDAETRYHLMPAEWKFASVWQPSGRPAQSGTPERVMPAPTKRGMHHFMRGSQTQGGAAAQLQNPVPLDETSSDGNCRDNAISADITRSREALWEDIAAVKARKAHGARDLPMVAPMMHRQRPMSPQKSADSTLKAIATHTPGPGHIISERVIKLPTGGSEKRIRTVYAPSVSKEESESPKEPRGNQFHQDWQKAKKTWLASLGVPDYDQNKVQPSEPPSHTVTGQQERSPDDFMPDDSKALAREEFEEDERDREAKERKRRSKQKRWEELQQAGYMGGHKYSRMVPEIADRLNQSSANACAPLAEAEWGVGEPSTETSGDPPLTPDSVRAAANSSETANRWAAEEQSRLADAMGNLPSVFDDQVW